MLLKTTIAIAMATLCTAPALAQSGELGHQLTTIPGCLDHSLTPSLFTGLVSGALWIWSSVVWWKISGIQSPFKIVGQRGALRIVVSDDGENAGGNMFNGLDWDPKEVDTYFKEQSRLNSRAAILSAVAAVATCITTVLVGIKL